MGDVQMFSVLIAMAYFMGMAARLVNLPPLVGFLLAGFMLNGFGVQKTGMLETIADTGITLLLFTIGLKLDVRSLFKPHVWGVTALHMAISVPVLGVVLLWLSTVGLSTLSGLDLRTSLLIGFALSFSSTVFAVKVLEEKAETGALHGRIAISILIMQDLLAVVFIAVSSGKAPSLWALALLAAIPLRPLLFRIMEQAGHGELLILLGWLLPIAGANLFDLVGLKPDLGALALGILLAGHYKSAELAKVMLGFKDLFLVAFFLNIGLAGAPSWEILWIATLLVMAVPFKVALLFWLMTQFRLRARTATLGSLCLANYSEFGLIVGSIGVAQGWMNSAWLTVIAVAVSLTFIIAAPINTYAHSLYAHRRDWLYRFERPSRLPSDEPIDAGDAEIVVFGMGPIGTGTYDYMHQRYGDIVLGIDHDAGQVSNHRSQGRNVIHGDATDTDFWDRAIREHRIRLALLTMEDYASDKIVAKILREFSEDRGITISAFARYDDEVRELKESGVDIVFNFYADAGAGFAQHVHHILERNSA